MSPTAQDFIRRRAQGQNASTVTVQRNTTALDSSRFPTDSWATHLSGINAAVQIRSGAEAVRYGRENNRRFGTVYLPPGYDITEADRIVYNGRTFDIQSVRTPDDRRNGDPLAYMVLEIQETDP